MEENKKEKTNQDIKKEVKEVVKGLQQKPIRRQGTPIGSRELTNNFDTDSTLNIPEKEKGSIRMLVFGGVGEIGKNMFALEYDDQILILDCGMHFGSLDLPGIDFTVPNIKYLEERKDKIVGMIISHAHLDHIGGISVLYSKLGRPTIYTRKLSIAMIENRHKEFTTEKPLKFQEVQKGDELQLSKDIKLTFFAVTHTIPDAMGTIIETPTGSVVFTGDLKLTHKDGIVDPEEVAEYEVFKKKKILLTLSDSTNAERPGFSKPEAKIVENLSQIILETKGRIIVGSFASQIERAIAIIENTIKGGKKIVVQGRSMLTNLSIASDLGLFKIPLNAIVQVEKMHEYPKEQIVVLATGSQGEEFAALNRMSKGSHKYIKIDSDDTVVFSSSIIPGNEENILGVKDRLSHLGANLVTYQTSDVHSSGHANRDELKWIHEKLNAKFFIPTHGYHYMMTAHARILEDIGMPKENIVVPNNGSIIDISPDAKKITHQEYTMPTSLTVIDGNAIGEVQNVVLSDRKVLKQDGIFVFILLIDQKQRIVKKSPDIISRGFVYLKESQQFIRKTRYVARKMAERNIKKDRMINLEILKKNLTREMQNYIYAETKRRPIVVPVIFIS